MAYMQSALYAIVRLPVCLSACLSVRLSVCLSSSSDYTLPRLHTKFDEHSHMLDSPHGTRFQRTYAPTKIAKFLGNNSKLFFTLAFNVH